jgi:CubicO group peptidase (beta-lactamase class C family)
MCNHSFLQAVLFCWLLFLTATMAKAHTASQIDAVVLDEMNRQGIVGMAVGIISDGQILYASGYGYQDLAATKPVTTSTVFRWASVSKTLTASAVLKLAETDPQFSLDDRVAKYVAYWPRYGSKADIRIWQLLSHRAGIIHYRSKAGCFDNPWPDYRLSRYSSHYYNARQSVDIFSHQPLCFAPGTGFKYSTFGYSLLGATIEGATGKSYAAWINDNIKQPLAMQSLHQSTAKRAGYTMKNGHLIPVSDGNVAWRLPGGGWESNIIDMAKFANAIIQGKLLKNTEYLWANVVGNHIYGLGMKHNADNSLVWHEGYHINNRSLLALFPDSPNRLGIVVLTNSAHSEPMAIIHRLAKLLL